MHLNSIQVPIDQLQLQDIELDQKLSYKENPIAILVFSKRGKNKNHENGESAMEPTFSRTRSMRRVLPQYFLKNKYSIYSITIWYSVYCVYI
jgi:hypothetical protein